MGNPKSKPKREAEVAPKVRIDSPTTVNTSTGFHLLEFHGPTEHRHTRVLCVSNGVGGGILIPPHQQEEVEKGGKVTGVRKSRPRNRHGPAMVMGPDSAFPGQSVHPRHDINSSIETDDYAATTATKLES